MGVLLLKRHAVLQCTAWRAASLLNRVAAKSVGNGAQAHFWPTLEDTGMRLWRSGYMEDGASCRCFEYMGSRLSDGVFLGLSGTSDSILVGTEENIQDTGLQEVPGRAVEREAYNRLNGNI